MAACGFNLCHHSHCIPAWRLDQTGIEWAENPSNDASYDVARIVTEEASVGKMPRKADVKAYDG